MTALVIMSGIVLIVLIIAGTILLEAKSCDEVRLAEIRLEEQRLKNQGTQTPRQQAMTQLARS